MDDKPDSNQQMTDEESDTGHASVGRDHIVITGDVGTGANIGSGTYTADNVAGGDITVNNGPEATADRAEFTRQMLELRRTIVEAHKSGEINERVARKMIDNLNDTAKLASEADPPPKNAILSKLQYIADILDTAVDMLGNGPGRVLVRALPIAALLIKIATRIF